eukprot:6179534-Pleurochrysis_carterae.AAC.8
MKIAGSFPAVQPAEVQPDKDNALWNISESDYSDCTITERLCLLADEQISTINQSLLFRVHLYKKAISTSVDRQ